MGSLLTGGPTNGARVVSLPSRRLDSRASGRTPNANLWKETWTRRDAKGQGCPPVIEGRSGVRRTPHNGSMLGSPTHIMVVFFADASQSEGVCNAPSLGGTVEMPLAHIFWAHRFGMCTDRFGIMGMVGCDEGQPRWKDTHRNAPTGPLHRRERRKSRAENSGKKLCRLVRRIRVRPLSGSR